VPLPPRCTLPDVPPLAHAFHYADEAPGGLGVRMTAVATMTTAANINAAHLLAQKHAGEAIAHARTAGALLLQVKAELPHGGFLPWLAAHCEVSERQAQRYMRAAQGKPLPLRKLALPPKTDTVSDLIPHDFEPTPGRWMLGQHGDKIVVIEPASEHPGYYFVSHMRLVGDDDAESWCLTRPAHAAAVELILADCGVEASSMAWYMGKSNGVRAALEAQQ
jgi:hypothetical protein